MERLSHWLAWGTVIVIVLFAGLNWSVLTMPAPMNLLVMRIDAPVGAILLGLTTIFIALFLVATLYSRIGALLETRRLLKEIQRVQELADKAEASRMQSLQLVIVSEFRALNDRVSQLRIGPETSAPRLP